MTAGGWSMEAGDRSAALASSRWLDFRGSQRPLLSAPPVAVLRSSGFVEPAVPCNPPRREPHASPTGRGTHYVALLAPRAHFSCCPPAVPPVYRKMPPEILVRQYRTTQPLCPDRSPPDCCPVSRGPLLIVCPHRSVGNSNNRVTASQPHRVYTFILDMRKQ